ncbi:MAG: 1-(5-phosphoribosyl)-5-[(5-phosphoribosylamino)methylideneamino]imidazole-4-carboxamide isomerase [Candidatus Omnitrophica bacterium]|nr:1-(5-phosphoribosyl)-5-[(5-phosphoribosylamino)methylideneamino]imidazole-4-carboxamide isomerase [Candidatus Omnitrophota bacterium]
MKIIPAIDLKDGNVVRLTRGRYDDLKVYSSNASEIAKLWYSQGAEMLHVVDLDGALEGVPKNMDSVAAIIRSVDIPIQFGGGLRDMDVIDKAFDIGVSKVILGSKVVEDLDFIVAVVEKYKEKVIVSVDANRGIVMIQGWTASSGLDALELAQKIKGMGVKSMIYTDVSVDGTLRGPNLETLEGLLDDIDLPVIVAGGISSVDDIKRLSELDRKNLIGVIIGKALYEGAIDLREAISICLRRE